MSSASGSNRSYKRLRTEQYDEPDPENVRSAVNALLERLASIREKAETTRDEHISTIKEIDERIASKQTAIRAASRVVVPLPSDEITMYTRGVRASSSKRRASYVGKQTLPPAKLLLECDPPEKRIHEQSIIVRAQAISRRNAELARERLPKQPEAQRNKTHWDYLLDEALWLSTDFREERKWKIHMAKRLARAVVAYHVQKDQRVERAAKAELVRIRRLANSVARDVRKFWSQIREIADLRAKQINDIRLQEKRNHHLQEVLQEAGHLASALSASYMEENTVRLENGSSNMLGPSSVVNAPKVPDRKVESPSPRDDSPGSSDSGRDMELSDSEEGDTREVGSSSDVESYWNEAAEIEDDETTMDVAEAENATDPHEARKLEAEATMSVEDLLRSRGIDPESYRTQAQQLETTENSEIMPLSSNLPKEGEGDANGISVVRESSADGEDALERTVPRISGYSVGKEAVLAVGAEYADAGDASSGAGRTSSGRLTAAGDGVSTAGSSEGVSRANGTEHGIQFSTPRLLRGSLRSYQLAGVQWLVALYKKNVNGILADEMGLGKTIQTIALLAWLALEKGIWGPHLIVVPTSVMVNWEVELKKWLPAFKVLTYFGSQKERKAKRIGWTRPDSFHICITSYTLVVQDAASLRRKEWVYLILDEAHNIKNFQSQRWQVLLRFPSAHRLLLTGTPLQNSVMELWSLLHFLMPKMFESQTEFKDWFYTPLSNVAKESEQEDSKQMVAKLHEVLRPFLLRRLKCDVEKSLRPKVEHILKCPLSKRQRQLYEDFLSRSDTQNTLERGDFFGVMGVLMQLRKVCNHPDLFEGRPILSPFSMKPVFYPVPSLVMSMESLRPVSRIDFSLLGLDLATEELMGWGGEWHTNEAQRLSAVSVIKQECEKCTVDECPKEAGDVDSNVLSCDTALRIVSSRRSILRRHALLTSYKVRKRALLGEDAIFAATITPGFVLSYKDRCWKTFSKPLSFVKSFEHVVSLGNQIFERFVCCIRKVDVPSVELRFSGDDAYRMKARSVYQELCTHSSSLRTLFRVAHVRSGVTLPDARLVQWDCGKLQVLAKLLRMLKDRSSRVLIYSQMSKVLNILESFLNLHGIRYLRLDGSTKTGDRQRIVERFNTDPRIFCMILTTRAGGVGLNLTGADTVIFYDTDYNPAIDAQAQDRVHRIGQKKTVHIYRLVSEKTVEENILKRANEKRTLESIVISQAGFDIDSIRKRSGIDDLVRSPANGREKPNFGLLASLNKPVSSGSTSVKLSGVLPTNKLTQKLNTSNDLQTQQVPVFSAHGSVNPLSWVDKESKHKQKSADVPSIDNSENSVRLLAENSDAYNTLLADDEDAGAALKPEDHDDEFLDPDVSDPSPKVSKSKNKRLRSFDNISRSLTAVQRFALKFVEQEGVVQGDTASASNFYEAPSEELPNAVSTDLPGVVDSHVDYTKEAVLEQGDDLLFYEQSITPNAYLSSLKVLTDTDANIKLYLPLRDGGPEELNISTVVNGTAAAGLECAEDAAFFPHAYNRMSRTIHATKRQKEKAAAGLRRRGEMEAKRLRDAKFASAQRAAAQRLAGQVNVGGDQRNRNGATRYRDEISGLPSSKRARTDSSSSGVQISGPDGGLFPGTNGLFRKNVKRNQRKVSSRYNKSSLSAGSGNLQLGEGVGKNDGWTIEEDQNLIELMSRYNANMAIVADVLSSHPEVLAGNRRRRSIRQCCDHWFNSILKEHKNGSPATTSSLSESEVLKQNYPHLVAAAVKSGKSFRMFDVKPLQGSEVHKSHARVTQEAKKSTSNRIDPSVPPTYDQTNAKIALPRGHLSGMKPYECTAHALQKKKNPFLRPLTDAMGPIMSSDSISRESSSTFRRAPFVAPSSTVRGPSPRPNRGPQNSTGLVQNHARTQSAKNGGADVGKTTNIAKPPLHMQKRIGNRTYQKAVSGAVVMLGTAPQQNNPTVSRIQASQRPVMAPVTRRHPLRTSAPGANGAQIVPSGQTTAIRQLPQGQSIPGASSSSKLAANSAGAHRRITAPSVRKPSFPGKISDAVLKPTVATGVNRVVGQKPKMQAAAPAATRLQPRTQSTPANVTGPNNIAMKVEHRKVEHRHVPMPTPSHSASLVARTNVGSGAAASLPKVPGNTGHVPFKGSSAAKNTLLPQISVSEPKISQVTGGVHKTTISPSTQAPGVTQSAVTASNSQPTVKHENGTQQKVSEPKTILLEKSKGPSALSQ